MSELVLKIWDVQHGNATHIRTPNGRTIVIDLGDADSPSGSASRFSPLNFLRHRDGVQSIDLLVITHPHRDHLDDIENVGQFSVSCLQRPNWLTEADIRQGNKQQDTAKISQYLSLSDRFNAPVSRPNDPGVPEDWGGVVITTFYSAEVPRNNLNNHSLVTFMSYAGLKVMLPGDNESPSWNVLLGRQSFVSEIKNVDVLLAPHHGREAGYCSALFESGLKPRLTVISDDQAGSTSATSKYGNQTRGWNVQRPNGSTEQRSCVTTRCDGSITIKFGSNPSGSSYLNVKTER